MTDDSLLDTVLVNLRIDNSQPLVKTSARAGWSPLKIALVALIALCIIGIIVAIIFMITRNLKKKNRKSPGGGAAPAPKGSTAKGTSQPKYESVPTV